MKLPAAESLLLTLFCGAVIPARGAAEPPGPTRAFFERHCVECHDPDTKKGDLDLTALKFDLQEPKAFAEWVKVHDRVRDGEMPPKKKKTRPDAAENAAFLKTLAAPMIAADEARANEAGRATWRRMNRYEYENALRDLLGAPWLQIKDMLPEDGEAGRFNKIGDALDVSHVQMARYLGAADYALREVTAPQLARPKTVTTRYYARGDSSLIGKMKFSKFNQSPERATFPILGYQAQPEVRSGKAPATVGAKNPKLREQEAVGAVASSYEPIELHFRDFEARASGRYKLRFSGYSVWVGPGKEKNWWRPNLDLVSQGRRPETVTIYGETKPRQLRLLGSFDVGTEPTVREIDTYLLKGEIIRYDAARLFRSRPPNYHNPLAERDGQPGLAMQWLEVEGPILDGWPGAGHKLLFDNLPLKRKNDQAPVEVVSQDPADAERLLRRFMQRAYREPFADEDVARFLKVIEAAAKSGGDFANAMIAGYTAVLCSPKFVCLEEKPGKLDPSALAMRLACFLWNSVPDAELRGANLASPEILRSQADRLLADGRSRRFVHAFLDYWLDLRKIEATSPDAALYPDYYLDDLLVESAIQETRLFFGELLRENLPARNLVSSDFAMLNERLAAHYGLPPVAGAGLRRVSLPQDSVRGGLMTQASVLKVTANGTTTSPVLRGAWIMERMLGKPPPPPPASVPAIEPDTRGAHTIRQQLDAHRKLESCAACHAKIDPAGFALESFDVLGGWRDHYRALGDGGEPPRGFGKNGQPFAFHYAQPVDSSGALPDGRPFQDVRALKKLLLEDERQIARNLVQQLVVYATGAPVRFGDRPEIEAILDQTAADNYGVKSIVHRIVASKLFQHK
jgi:mono/diheme cytochrome c family protein